MKNDRLITDEDLKSILLDLLKFYSNFCDQNNLRYFLGGGTLLGAVRHSGFIPWDDDIDVMMPRPDYNRFIELMKNHEFKHISLMCNENTKNYPFPFAKLQYNNTLLIEGILYEKYQNIGVHIDVFPIDGLSNELPAAEKQFSDIQNLLELLAVKTTKISWNAFTIRKLLRCILVNTFLRLLSTNTISHYIDSKLQRFDYENSKFVASVVGAYGIKELMVKEQVADFLVMDFENLSLRVPIGYDKYLKDHYGDYMVLPPVDKQKGHAKREVYWRDIE